jgi:Zn-dependent membrane protease YugP
MLFGWFVFGPSIWILIPALILAVYAQWRVRSTYRRYAQVPSERGLTAETAARRLLQDDFVGDVTIERTKQAGRALSDFATSCRFQG